MTAYALPLLLALAPVTVHVHLASVQCFALIGDICERVERCHGVPGDREQCLEILGSDGPWGMAPTCQQINQWHDEIEQRREEMRGDCDG